MSTKGPKVQLVHAQKPDQTFTDRCQQFHDWFCDYAESKGCTSIHPEEVLAIMHLVCPIIATLGVDAILEAYYTVYQKDADETHVCEHDKGGH